MKLRFFLLAGAVLTVSFFAGACGDDDDRPGGGGTGGTSGSGGASGLGGAGGAGGQGGAAGQGGGEAGSGGVTPTVRQIEAGGSHTCVLLGDGGVRCWGSNFAGQLGYGHKRDIGDDEAPSTAGTVDLGGKAVQISVGAAHSCALLEGGSVRCWGQGDFGRLGYGNVGAVGDDEVPASAGPVELGERAQQISAGGTHTCALLESGGVLCWGPGAGGLLGYGNTDDVGDNETPASVNRVQLGGKALRISAGASHSCALLEGGNVRCWGSGAGGLLGYGNVDDVGDNETPDKAGPVELGDRAVEVVAANTHSCARLESGLVRCWGPGNAGPLGYGDENAIGDTEAPSTAGPVDLGGKAVELTGGFLRSCARLEDGAVRCWGSGQFGGLGYGNTDNVGDNEVPSTVGPVDLGGKAEGVSAGFGHVCALLEGGAVRCWGRGVGGALGYGNTDNVGDNETPSSIDAVRLF